MLDSLPDVTDERLIIEKNLRTIKIGHGAYSGANALVWVIGKAAAVRELRNRGVKRNDAREAIKRVSSRASGYEIIKVEHELIEIHAMNHDSDWHGYGYH